MGTITIFFQQLNDYEKLETYYFSFAIDNYYHSV